MRDRVILHSDLNNFYASVECLYNPALRGKPVAVAGDPEARHGIVLAKNEAAKKYGVATGDPLWTVSYTHLSGYSSSKSCQPSRFPPTNMSVFTKGYFAAAFSACSAVSPSAVHTSALTPAAS